MRDLEGSGRCEGREREKGIVMKGQLDLSLKKLPANAGDVGLIPGFGRSSGEGKGNPI